MAKTTKQASKKLKATEILPTKKDKSKPSFNTWFILTAIAFFALGIIELTKKTAEGETTMGATWIALGAVFIALSGTSYTPSKKK
jgi:hypothetical protein